MTEDQKIEFNSTISRIKDDLCSLRFELKAQKSQIQEILTKLKELANAK
jgi:archaellum component FlaC